MFLRVVAVLIGLIAGAVVLVIASIFVNQDLDI